MQAGAAGEKVTQYYMLNVNMIKFLDLTKQYKNIKSEIDLAISAVLNDSAFIGGKYVKQFEDDFAQYHGINHCVGVGNGTDALEITLEALELPPGSEVIVPANTFIAASEAVTRAGYKVVFCDCDPRNYTISTEDAKKRITPGTKAIMTVHLYGHPCDMDAVMSLAREHRLKVIEDCAQAHGAEYKGRRVGAFGDAGTFSFYPGKILGAYGDGGAIMTNNKELAVRCRMIANHGRLAKYNHEIEGRNSRLDGLQAAVLSVKLKYVDEWIAARIRAADYYSEHLKDIGDLVLPVCELYAKHVYHLFVVRSKKRDALQNYLKKNEIQTGVHYPSALPKLPAYEYLGQSNEPMFANRIDSELLSLPMGEHLDEKALRYVIEKIKDFFS